MRLNDYSVIANQYASLDNTGTAYLAFRDIPEIIKKYAQGKRTLDYGCGSGDSTKFLIELGLEVSGVDISQEMLNEAKSEIKNVEFSLIQSGSLPFTDGYFDIIFSSFVLFEISTKIELQKILQEINRVLKNNGVFIAITGSEFLYNFNWLSIDVNFPENTYLTSGDIAKVLLKDANLIVYDYFWTNNDYMDVFNASNFYTLEMLHPLGNDNDTYSWKDEIHKPPYVIYILSKNRL